MAAANTYTEIDPTITVCNDCGAHAGSADAVVHHATCVPGETDKWVAYYNAHFDPDEDARLIDQPKISMFCDIERHDECALRGFNKGVNGVAFTRAADHNEICKCPCHLEYLKRFQNPLTRDSHPWLQLP